MTDTDKPVPAETAPAAALPGFKTELQRTWDILKAKILIFVLIGLIGLAAITLVNGAWLALCGVLMSRVPPIFLLLMPVLALPLLILPMACMMTAALFALKESVHTVTEALRLAVPRLLGMVWIGLLIWVMTNGGFLLLFVPGVVLNVWFFFAWYIFMEEKSTGINVLVQSREYVRGRFFPVLLRVLAVALLCGVAVAVSSIAVIIPVLGLLVIISVGALAGMFFFVYGYVLYQDLRIRPGTIRAHTLSRNEKLKKLTLGLAGAAALLISFAWILPQKITAMRNTMNMIASVPGAGMTFKNILLGKPLMGKDGSMVMDEAAQKAMNKAMAEGMKELEKQMAAGGKKMPPELKKLVKSMQKPKAPKAAAAVPARAIKPSTSPPTVDELYSGSLRDPFAITGGGMARTQVRTSADGAAPFSIHDLVLTGIMRDRKGRQALLKNPNTGMRYTLIRGKLLDPKRKPVPGISGVIHGKRRLAGVTLMTEDKDVQPLNLHKKEE